MNMNQGKHNSTQNNKINNKGRKTTKKTKNNKGKKAAIVIALIIVIILGILVGFVWDKLSKINFFELDHSKLGISNNTGYRNITWC